MLTKDVGGLKIEQSGHLCETWNLISYYLIALVAHETQLLTP